MAFTEDQISHLKLLLEVQANGYNDSIDRLHREMSEMKKHYDEKIRDLEISLEYSYKDMEEIKKSMTPKDVFVKMEDRSRDELQRLDSRINKQEDYSRKHNLRIDGLEEIKSETSQQTEVKVLSIFKEYFNAPNIGIDVAHRIKSSLLSHKNNQTVLVRLKKISDRDFILRNTSKLKNSKIFINEDLCEETLKSRKAKIPEMKTARESGKIAYFIGDKLIIKNRFSPVPINSNRQNHTPTRPVSSLRNVFSPPETSPLPSPFQNSQGTPRNTESSAVNSQANEPRRSNRTVSKSK